MPPIKKQPLALTTSPSGLSAFACHKLKWANGCGSNLCSRASRIVLARGVIPCDVLMIGEGPGESEDTLGRPFVGPAGMLLDRILKKVIDGYRLQYEVEPPSIAFTNLVGCFPLTEGRKKAGEPEYDEVMQCRPRLEEFITIAQPIMVVAVGKLAKEYLEPGLKDSIKLPDSVKHVIHIIHPAAILKQPNVALKQHHIQRTEVTLSNAFEDHFSPTH